MPRDDEADLIGSAFGHQHIADALKSIIIARAGDAAPELERVQDFERLPWDSQAMQTAIWPEAGNHWLIGEKLWIIGGVPTAADVVALIDAYEAALPKRATDNNLTGASKYSA
ncbi:MAG TPA: hypothetical protein VHL11_23055 [Phototrophicaceae bacterium]|jgi:hypothetical protein|nr:hypothetical protein [Phototrophicaceae bacterium]